MNILKKQSVAWVITIVMVLAAIGIGAGKANTTSVTPGPSHTSAPLEPTFYVYDDANALSAEEESKLSRLIEKMYDDTGAVVACVVTEEGANDLFSFAIDYAEDIGLTGTDFIVVIDLGTYSYWLVQGGDLIDDFTDEDCGEYAQKYMEDDLVLGRYGDALLNLVQALYDWYRTSPWG